MRVDIEEIRRIEEARRRINSVPLEDIEWFEGGKKLEVSKEAVNDFRFVGLNNMDFITTGAYITTQP